MFEIIDYKDAILLDDTIFIDTRAPVEFKQDHIPEAINIPIFNNEERALVGTIYTKLGVKKAIEKGKQIYYDKIDDIKSKILVYKDKKIVIYCFRGGMRSKAITELTSDMGLNCYQLNGGYKKYRKYLREKLESFEFKPELIVLHGLTGTGKTDLLLNFKDMIDLEGLACHRSSVYGSIGLIPNSQKRFESLLFQRLNSVSEKKYVLIEGESRKIGSVIIPEFLFKKMKNGINVRVDSSMDFRVKRLISIYTNSPEDVEKTKKITLALETKLGKKVTSDLIKFLDTNDLASFMKLLLEKYYDPLYKHSIDKLNYQITVNNDDILNASQIIKKEFDII